MLGDLNGDQWPDLVVGNSGEPCVKVFYAEPPTTAVEPAIPAATALRGNYPNPFNPATTIVFELAEPGPVSLEIHDAAGRLVRTLVQGPQPAGRREAVWQGHDDQGGEVASGMYFYRLTTEDGSLVRKMLLLK